MKNLIIRAIPKPNNNMGVPHWLSSLNKYNNGESIGTFDFSVSSDRAIQVSKTEADILFHSFLINEKANFWNFVAEEVKSQ